MSGIALGVRAAVLKALVLPVVPDAVVDQVFIASIFEAKNGGTGFAYNSSAPVNVDGNEFSTMATFLKALRSAQGIRANLPKESRSDRSLESQLLHRGRALSAGGRRTMTVVLIGPKFAARDAVAGSFSATITFNLVFANAADADRMLSELRVTESRRLATISSLSAASASLALAIGNRTGVNSTSTQVDPSSVQLVFLEFKQTYWGIFLQWLYDHIRDVLAGACSLIVAFFLLLTLRWHCKRLVAQRKILLSMLAAEMIAGPFVPAHITQRMRLVRIKSKIRKQLLSAILKTAAHTGKGREGLPRAEHVLVASNPVITTTLAITGLPASPSARGDGDSELHKLDTAVAQRWRD